MNNKSKYLVISLLAAIIAYILYMNDIRDNPAPDANSSHHTALEDEKQSQPKHLDANNPSPTPEVSMDPALRAALNEMLSTSSEGLEVEENNGVTSIDLQGRFRIVPVATIDEQGEVHIREYSSPPGNQ
jgi:hypothetical protein